MSSVRNTSYTKDIQPYDHSVTSWPPQSALYFAELELLRGLCFHSQRTVQKGGIVPGGVRLGWGTVWRWKAVTLPYAQTSPNKGHSAMGSKEGKPIDTEADTC